MKRRCQRLTPVSTCLAALFCFTSLAAGGSEKPPAEYFGNFSGCALIVTRDRHHESRFEFGPEQCAMPLSPCSTFKIPNALIGLQTGVLSGPEHPKSWDGQLHERSVNNQDHTLASAIEHSVVWYFQSVARDIGPATMQEWLERLDYGNHDLSGGIERFWLGSSLEVSAYRQLEIIQALKHQTLPFRPDVQQQVADMLVQDSELAGTLHGKTGSCRQDGEKKSDHGWFVGWIDWQSSTGGNPTTTLFVLNIRGTAAWGWEARKIALALISDLQD